MLGVGRQCMRKGEVEDEAVKVAVCDAGRYSNLVHFRSGMEMNND